MDTNYLFDNAISDKRLKIMKTAIPYFNPEQQKMMSMYIVFKELQNTINFFSNSDYRNEIGICSVEKEKRTSGNMINDIKKILDDNEKEKIDSILTAMSMIEMYSTMINSDGQAT